MKFVNSQKLQNLQQNLQKKSTTLLFTRASGEHVRLEFGVYDLEPVGMCWHVWHADLRPYMVLYIFFRFVKK